MAKEPNDLVVRILREIQAAQANQGKTLDEHTREFQKIRSSLTEIRESLVTALGLGAHANVRNDLMENRLGELEARIGKLDELDARVRRLETEEA